MKPKEVLIPTPFCLRLPTPQGRESKAKTLRAFLDLNVTALREGTEKETELKYSELDYDQPQWDLIHQDGYPNLP